MHKLSFVEHEDDLSDTRGTETVIKFCHLNVNVQLLIKILKYIHTIS